MDDKLILAVFNFPQLYNVTLTNYRCNESRSNAWATISTLVGLPSDDCKRKWKNLRDRYLKEVRMEIKSKLQGEMIPSRWKYRQLMNFIAPFTGSRSGIVENGSNNDDDPDNPDEESGNSKQDPAPSESLKASQTTKSQVSPSDPKSHMAFENQMPQDTQLGYSTKIPSSTTPITKLGRKRRFMRDTLSPSCSSATPVSTKMQENGPTSNSPRDEDEMFLLSFVPALKRLTPQKRCETKISFQQIMYEAEFQPASKMKLTEGTED